MPNLPFTEKRAFPRFPICIPLNYLDSNSGQTIQTQTHDISAQGLCLVTDRELPLGACLEIYIKMLDNGEQIYRRGQVAWSDLIGAGKYRIGIRLEEPKLKPIPLVLRVIKAQRKY